MYDIALNNIKYAEIRIGDTASFHCRVDEDAARRFAELTGDRNPLHCDEAYAAGTPLGGRIAQGMLLASFFSTLVGMRYPGRYCLYLSQDAEFRKPVHIGEEILVRGAVTVKSDAVKVIEMRTEIINQQGAVVVSGRARVRLLA